MPSALSRRLEERQRILDEFRAQTDLVRYEDGNPEIVAQGAEFVNGQMVKPARHYVSKRLIKNGVVQLASLSGIGDALWTRGVVRETLKAGLQVVLDTPHRWAFWDFEGAEGFRFYDGGEGVYVRGATYLGQDIVSQGLSVYKAMCQRCHVPLGDFSLPIRPEWDAEAVALLDRIQPGKPVMVYRPLVRNHGRRSVESRNPDHAAYSAIFRAIRDRFHVVSVCTDGAGESIIHADQADSVFHHGEVGITTLMALMARSGLVYTSAGMALVAASAVGARLLAVMGGYEPAANYRDTAGVYGHALLIDPINPCACMADNHPCDKRIDIPAATRAAIEFLEPLCPVR